MKYIKTFEKISNNEIKINNLVHDKNGIFVKPNVIGVVTNIIKSKIKRTSYLVTFNVDNETINVCFTKNELTKLTHEEIEEYKIKKDANKYNL